MVVHELRRCQEARRRSPHPSHSTLLRSTLRTSSPPPNPPPQAAGSGFISAWPEAVFDALEGGRFAEVWAPWYTVHKILAGLLDAHTQLAGTPKAAAGVDTAAKGSSASENGDGAGAGASAGASAVALEVAQRYGAYLVRRVDAQLESKGEDWWQARGRNGRNRLS